MKNNRLFFACVGGSLGLATILLLVAGFAAIRALRYEDQGFQLVTQTYATKEAISGLMLDVRAMRVAHRAYVGGGGLDAMIQFDDAQTRLRIHLNGLWSIPHDREQLERVQFLTDMLSDRYSEFLAAMNLYAAGESETALRVMNNRRGNGEITELTQIADRITLAADRSLSGRIADTTAANSEAKRLIFSGLALSILVIVFCGAFVFRDLLRRLRAERALRTAALRLQDTLNFQHALVNSAAYGIIATDARGMITDFNRTAEQMLGFAAGEVIGKATADVFYDPVELERRGMELAKEAGFLGAPGFAVLSHLPHQGQVEEREWSYVRHDGKRLPVHVSMTAIRDEAGGIGGYLAIARDITEGRKVERLKRDFVSTVSHELRTPLTSIRGSLGLVLGTFGSKLPEQVKGLLQIAHNNVDRLSRLINDILDMEKIESGKMEFNLRRQPLGPLLQSSLDGTNDYARQFAVNLVLQDNADGAEVEVDSDRFIQIMVNLLSNAAKFSPAGGAVVVSAERRDGGVRISVSDKGKGIPVEFKSRIFQKFAQADSSDSRIKTGTGLGLSITKAMVEKMNGSISFETQVGQGTTFHVDLPEARSGALPGRRARLPELRHAG